MWEIWFGLGIAALGAAFAYGIYMSRRRNRANDNVRDAAVRNEYSDPEGYDPARFEKEAERRRG